MRRPLVAGNWKMNGSKESVASLLQHLKEGCEHIERAELAVLAPFIFLSQCEESLMRTQIAWGAQDVATELEGAYTGEVSASMLKDFHCRYVIVGHSERRTLYGETNEQVALKCQAALSADILPIICVGETEEQRLANQTLAIVEEQLAAVLAFHNNGPALDQIVIAYEPLWAIGTGRQASPEQAQAVHEAIRSQLASTSSALAEQVRILYGGSVKPDNAAGLFAMPDIDGALVGGASLKAETFFGIGKQCNNSF